MKINRTMQCSTVRLLEFVFNPIQASLGPYAWERDGHDGRKVRDHTSLKGVHLQGGSRSRSPPRVVSLGAPRPNFLQDADLCGLDRTTEVFNLIEQEKHMSYSLPKPGVTAGRVLAHATREIEDLMRRHVPMTFKIGITHCARFRWYHKPYGYKHGLERFEFMHIIFAAANPVGPAFLEAALIDKFRSFSACHGMQSGIVTCEL